MERIAWHPAFVEAIQVELENYRDGLQFEAEHQLTAEPLKIDVLIIKKSPELVIDKNIGRIFRANNIVEYKARRITFPFTIMIKFTLTAGFTLISIMSVSMKCR